MSLQINSETGLLEIGYAISFTIELTKTNENRYDNNLSIHTWADLNVSASPQTKSAGYKNYIGLKSFGSMIANDVINHSIIRTEIGCRVFAISLIRDIKFKRALAKNAKLSEVEKAELRLLQTIAYAVYDKTYRDQIEAPLSEHDRLEQELADFLMRENSIFGAF